MAPMLLLALSAALPHPHHHLQSAIESSGIRARLDALEAAVNSRAASGAARRAAEQHAKAMPSWDAWVRLQFEDGPRKRCLAATDAFAVAKPGTVAAMFGAKGFEFNMPSYLSTYTVTAKKGKKDSSMKATEYPGGIPARFYTYTGEEMPDGPVGSCPLKISTITSNQDKNIPQPGEMELLARKIDGLESDLVMTCEQEAYYSSGLTGETTDSKKSLAWFIADSVTGKAKRKGLLGTGRGRETRGREDQGFCVERLLERAGARPSGGHRQGRLGGAGISLG
tara:strand:- start:1273 stop:2115 length:843 start_codon:yes stop_codon:yes gene_type:complete